VTYAAVDMDGRLRRLHLLDLSAGNHGRWCLSFGGKVGAIRGLRRVEQLNYQVATTLRANFGDQVLHPLAGISFCILL